MAALDFNVAEADESKAEGGSFSLLPRGRHLCQLKDGEVKDNSKRTGKVFNFKIEAVDGDLAGSWFFASINVSHEKPNTRAQGQAQLKELALAQGQDPNTISDTDQYLGYQFYCDVDIQPNTYKGVTKDQNVFVRFVHEGNHDKPIPGDSAPANDNKPQPTTASNDNKPQPTQNVASGGGSASGGGRPSLPWKPKS
jgi:hypothetical protein